MSPCADVHLPAALLQVVLLSDNGLSVSQRSLSVYCQVKSGIDTVTGSRPVGKQYSQANTLKMQRPLVQSV